MNNTFIVTLLAMILVILLTVLAVTLANGRTGSGAVLLPESSQPIVSSAPEASLPPAGERYVLGCYDGRLALFPVGDPVPERVYEVWVSRLPEADRRALEKGILIESDERLAQLLEDYTS